MGENCVEDYHVDGVVEVSAITQPIRSFTSKEGGRIQDYIVFSQSRELWRLLYIQWYQYACAIRNRDAYGEPHSPLRKHESGVAAPFHSSDLSQTTQV